MGVDPFRIGTMQDLDRSQTNSYYYLELLIRSRKGGLNFVLELNSCESMH